jgi:hypothetical protein
MDPMEDQARRTAEAIEYEMDDMVEAEAPRGPFGVRAMNALVDSHNKVLRVMGAPEKYPRFKGESVDEFPARFVRELAMVADAAETAGAALDMELASIESDRDVMLLAGKLEALAKDDAFKEAMAQEIEEDEAEEGPEVGVAVMVDGAEDDTDNMFASRMG